MFRERGALARRNRLAHPDEFRMVFRSPVRSEDGKLLFIARRNGLGYPRLGLAIPRKRIKRAVTRNRLKRLIRESFRKHRGVLGGVDIVVTVTADLDKLDNKSINESINRHWNKLTKCDGQQSR
ncbi:MAG: ribonuclease P protein component [Gammaproteobacteria bacterium]